MTLASVAPKLKREREYLAVARAELVRMRVQTMSLEPERWYIGRRHVADSHGDPVVVDWRADVSTAFYRASRTEPMGVSLRRRFGIDRGQLTAYEDERLDPDDPARAGRHRAQ